MKCKSLEQIALDADVHPAIGMSRCERLERWAEPLEGQPERRLSAIEGTDFGGRRERGAKGTDNSRSPWHSRIRCCVLRGFGAIGSATRSSSLTFRRVTCITSSATAITG